MSETKWTPQVGERVVIYGTVEQDDQSNYPFKVRFEGGDGYVWAKRSEVAPLPSAPEPRKPWDVLREAADIIALESEHTKGGAAFDFLTFEAARLEAAAAPKPPTLAEAVRAYDQDPGAKWSDVMQALAREEKST